MLTNKKNLITVILGLCVVLAAFAQNAERTTQLMLEKADDFYLQGETKQAFSAINNALKLNETTYKEDGVPANVIIIARPIYRQVLNMALDKKDYDLLDEVNERVEKFPDLADDNIKRQIKKIETQKAEDAAAKREAAAKAERTREREEDRLSTERLLQSVAEENRKVAEETRKNNESMIQTLSEENRSALQTMSEENRKNNESMVESMTTTISEGFDKQAELQERQFSETRKSNHTVLIAILGVCGVLVIIFIIVIINIISSARANARQQQQFEATLKLVAGMTQTNNQLLLGGVTDLGGLRSAGSSRWGVDALPAPEMSETEKLELKELAIACEDKGSKIDQISKRKNNSKNVSELVFKLAQNLGLNQNTSMIYFCASMVYDIGFLSLPEELVNAENLTDEQRQQLREHLTSCEKEFSFVPEKYRQIFIDAAKSHNENMDGSGYPAGLEGEAIPQIARLIHVAESYNALVSRRSYRATHDKESAIEEMKSKPGLYDAEVVAVLDAIV